MEKELKQGYHMEILLQKPKSGAEALQELDEEAAKHAMRFHRSIPQYQETPLVSLKKLSKRLGVKGIYVKNESLRFGLKAFKGLGGTYAMFRILCRELKMDVEKADFRDFQKKDQREKAGKITFVTAMDGNHGKGVSWAAGLLGCQTPWPVLKDVRKQLGLGADSVILLFNTEGDTDPVCCRTIARDGAYALA